MSSATLTTPPVTSQPPKQLSGLPLIGNVFEFQTDRLKLMFRIANECGDIGLFKIGPKPVAVITSAEMVDELLVKKGESADRGPFFASFVPLLGKHSLITTDGPYHREQRKLHTPSFGHRRMPKYAEGMMECIQPVVDGYKDGQHIDMADDMARLARLITAKTLFNIEEGDKVDYFQKAIFLVERHISMMSASLVPLPLSWPTPANNRARAAIAEMRHRADEIIAEYRARNQDFGDLLSLLMQAKDDAGNPLSDEQLRDHTITMYIAGQETTAVALTWLAIHMAQNPDIQEKARQEADAVLQGRPPTYDDLAKLPYNLQVVKECLRLCPPAGAVGRETLEEVDIGGYRLPKGQFILISPYVLQHREKYYPEPDKFIPERFLPEEEKKRPRAAFVPFGTGVHTCLGNHFAVMEMHLALAYMVQKMYFELEPGQTIVPKLYITVKPTSAKFIIRRRQ